MKTSRSLHGMPQQVLIRLTTPAKKQRTQVRQCWKSKRQADLLKYPLSEALFLKGKGALLLGKSMAWFLRYIEWIMNHKRFTNENTFTFYRSLGFSFSFID